MTLVSTMIFLYDSQNAGSKSRRQMGGYEAKEFLHNQGNNQYTEETTHRGGAYI
jgi:hypothetical protein